MDLRNIYRIIQGHFRFNVGDSVFLFTEPSSETLYQSYEHYQDVYDEAYGNSCLVTQDLNNLLIEQDLWSPLFDKSIEDLYTDVDKHKLEAYKSFLNTRERNRAKFNVFDCNEKIKDLLNQKHQLDYLGCEFVAEYSRNLFIVERCVKRISGEPRQLQSILDEWQKQCFDYENIRDIAKSSEWRGIWAGSKREGSLFGKPATELSADQKSLISYSQMYDSVYEHPEKPSDEVIDDNVCLDGWFIFQHKKQESEGTKNKIDNVLTNDKIKNAKEVFIMADNQEDAQKIIDVNDDYTKGIMHQRSQTIEKNERVKDFDFTDVKNDIEIEKSKIIKEQHTKGTK